MSCQIPIALITIVVAFPLIIEPVHGENKTESDVDRIASLLFDWKVGSVCEKVIANISNCEKNSCSTIGLIMVKKCSGRYEGDQTILQKCEEWPSEEDQSKNHFLTLTVINTKREVVYWNMYCALCNYDYEFEFADPVLLPITVERCGLRSFSNFDLNKAAMNEYTKVLCNGSISRIIREDVLDSPYYTHCDDTPSYTELHDPSYNTFRKYCDNHSSIYCPDELFRSDLLCSYRSDVSKYCAYDWFLFEGFNFAYGENGSIYTPWYPKNKFLRDEYSNLTGIKGVIYICGQEVRRPHLALKIFTLLFYSTSVVFLLLYMMLNTNKQSLQNLPNRALYSFCITQLMHSLLRVNAEFPTIDGSCIVVQFIFGYTAFAGNLWNLVVFFEYSRVIYFLIRNLEPPAKVEKKKHLIYCFVCWVIPAIPTVFPLFFISMVDKKTFCPKIEDYSLVYCGYDSKSHQYAGVLFEIVLEPVFAVCPKILAVGSIGALLVIVYSSAQNALRSNDRKYLILKKTSLMCLILSFPFVFSCLDKILESPADRLLFDIYEILDSLLGVFIFVVSFYYRNLTSEVPAKGDLRKTPQIENFEIRERKLNNVSQFSKNRNI